MFCSIIVSSIVEEEEKKKKKNGQYFKLPTVLRPMASLLPHSLRSLQTALPVIGSLSKSGYYNDLLLSCVTLWSTPYGITRVPFQPDDQGLLPDNAFFNLKNNYQV